MTRVRLVRAFAIFALAAALAAAGIAVNVLLLGYADPNDDPVGTLTPRATLTEPAATTRPPPATREEDDERDD